MKASEGNFDVPAGPVRVLAERTHPSGRSDKLEYNIDVTTAGNYLPLPRMMDLYVGGHHKKSWYQPHTNSNPPTDIRVTIPGKLSTVPASSDGLLLPEGEDKNEWLAVNTVIESVPPRPAASMRRRRLKSER